MFIARAPAAPLERTLHGGGYNKRYIIIIYYNKRYVIRACKEPDLITTRAWDDRGFAARACTAVAMIVAWMPIRSLMVECIDKWIIGVM